MTHREDGRVEYEGNWKNDMFHGKGKYNFYFEGAYEEGEFRKSKKHGHCRFDYGDGTFFSGVFFKGLIKGHGRYDMKDGAYYEGNYLDDVYSGQGTLFEDGIKFVGEFKEGEKHGRGV